MNFLEIIGATWLVCAAIVVLLLLLAEDGYEDEDGFHRGRDPRHQYEDDVKDWEEDTPKTERRFFWEFAFIGLLSVAGVARWLLG